MPEVFSAEELRHHNSAEGIAEVCQELIQKITESARDKLRHSCMVFPKGIEVIVLSTYLSDRGPSTEHCNYIISYFTARGGWSDIRLRYNKEENKLKVTFYL